jgi:hypothetical protein
MQNGGMRDPHPWRSITISFVAAAVFGVGFYLYIRHSIDEATAKSIAETNAVTQRAEARLSLLDTASAVAAPFVAHVGAARFAQAYELLAAPYRRAMSVGAFTESCRASPILARARSVTLRQLRQQSSATGGASFEANGVLDSEEGTVPVSFVFLREDADLRVLVVAIGGVPVLQGVARRNP